MHGLKSVESARSFLEKLKNNADSRADTPLINGRKGQRIPRIVFDPGIKVFLYPRRAFETSVENKTEQPYSLQAKSGKHLSPYSSELSLCRLSGNM